MPSQYRHHCSANRASTDLAISMFSQPKRNDALPICDLSVQQCLQFYNALCAEVPSGQLDSLLLHVA